MRIESGRPEHAEQAADLMHAYYLELPDWVKTSNFDRVRLVARLSYLTVSPQWQTYVAFDGEEMVGVVAGCAAPTQEWSEELTACMTCLYVQPSYRGSSAGVKLIRAFEEWAKGTACTAVSMSVGSALSIDRTLKLYERMGYKLYGYETLKEI